jgi:hypothetical protein
VLGDLLLGSGEQVREFGQQEGSVRAVSDDRFCPQGGIDASASRTTPACVVPSNVFALHGKDSTNGITPGQGICLILLQKLLLIILFRTSKSIPLASAP